RRYHVIPDSADCRSVAHRQCDSDTRANLVVKHIASFLLAALSRCSRVTPQVEVIDPMEVLAEVLSKSVKRDAVQKPVVRHHANDPVSPLQSICRPTEEFDISVVQFAFAAGFGIPCV